MEAASSGTYFSKQKQVKGESSKKGSQIQAGKPLQYCELQNTASASGEKSRTKQSRFPSLSKLGRAHTFSFGRKKDKDNEKKIGGKSSKTKENAMDKSLSDYAFKEGTRRKSQESQKFDAMNYDDKYTKTYRKPAMTEETYRKENEYTRTTSASRHYELSRSRSATGGKENRTRDLPTASSSKNFAVKERKSPKRKDCKRKELPIDRGFDHDNMPLWLRNPPKILIQDFSSDYVDETTFDEEYFDLVQWAFRILEQQCSYNVYSNHVGFKRDNEEPTLLGSAQKDPLSVITAETARVGSTLDYILHPISTGAANVIQTGAKFADFTTRVFRGISFDSIIKKRNDPETPSKK